MHDMRCLNVGAPLSFSFISHDSFTEQAAVLITLCGRVYEATNLRERIGYRDEQDDGQRDEYEDDGRRA